ncbi:GNAT family N-acetyltransferase [Stackebrandtia endophytica]|nr:N-acetyltransferase [Stackebrandtia endophytica]
MPFEQLHLVVPDRLATEDFILRPITADDAESDHAAVMESRHYLRRWEQSSWPTDDFTVGANREDLAGLERRHADGRAFTYTVVDPAEVECLGCVYLMSTDARMFTEADIAPLGDHRWDDYQAAVYFWVRQSRLGTSMDRALLDTLRIWLDRDWGFEGYLLVTNEEFTQQVELIEQTDLRRRFVIAEAGKSGRYLGYA